MYRYKNDTEVAVVELAGRSHGTELLASLVWQILFDQYHNHDHDYDYESDKGNHHNLLCDYEILKKLFSPWDYANSETHKHFFTEVGDHGWPGFEFNWTFAKQSTSVHYMNEPLFETHLNVKYVPNDNKVYFQRRSEIVMEEAATV